MQNSIIFSAHGYDLFADICSRVARCSTSFLPCWQSRCWRTQHHLLQLPSRRHSTPRRIKPFSMPLSRALTSCPWAPLVTHGPTLSTTSALLSFAQHNSNT